MTARRADVRVMSFNILKEKVSGHAASWQNRKERVVLAIRAFDPDLLGAQEVQYRQAEYLRGELGDYGFVSAGRDQGLFAGECAAVFYRSERFEKLNEGHFWLSREPDRPGSRHWHSVVPRIVTWAHLRDVRGGRRMFLFNTHFCPLSWRARLQSVWVLRRQVHRLAEREPVVVTGDFNTRAGGKAYNALLGGMDDGGLRLLDTYRVAHSQAERYEGTWHGPSGRRARRRIDWILHTPDFTVLDAEIDRERRDGRFPSDHFPVTATLR
ncbi:MAG TPA: endonuclease/exonuclease/phosphatase family protein [Phycisphaerae bacterium]|nr:endonuclease/exonuclease/phosphatase family protein [Phycisphaerae bacterium]